MTRQVQGYMDSPGGDLKDDKTHDKKTELIENLIPKGATDDEKDSLRKYWKWVYSGRPMPKRPWERKPPCEYERKTIAKPKPNTEWIKKIKEERRKNPPFWVKKKKISKEKKKCYSELWRALRHGELERKSKCEICQSDNRIEAHHDDYSKPLEVKWLCKRCHMYADKERRKNEMD